MFDMVLMQKPRKAELSSDGGLLRKADGDSVDGGFALTRGRRLIDQDIWSQMERAEDPMTSLEIGAAMSGLRGARKDYDKRSNRWFSLARGR